MNSLTSFIPLNDFNFYVNKQYSFLIYFIFHQLQMEMAFPKELFRFAWNIAEFIISGNRRERDEQYKIINIK